MLGDDVVEPLSDPSILVEISRAWEDSFADDRISRHEEGGYIVQGDDPSFSVVRFHKGDALEIAYLPLDADNRHEGRKVIATFHTHPNPPEEVTMGILHIYPQVPSYEDIQWHKNRKLRGFVISRKLVWEIGVDGTVREIGRREDVLGFR